MIKKIQTFLANSASSLATLLKIAILSRRPSPRAARRPGSRIYILGNGPTLREVLDDPQAVGILRKADTLAVNLSILTPEIRDLRPAHYVLADPAFFAREKKGRIPAVWEALAATNWPMTLWLPASARRMKEIKDLPGNIKTAFYNLTPATGGARFVDAATTSGLAMPRPRNVLIPAIVCMERAGYSEIILLGADHNWSRTLWVTDRNRVVSVQPHFYADSSDELRRAEEVFAGVTIADIFGDYAVTFRSHKALARWAPRRGVQILNATPGSFIDAYPRIQFPAALRDSNT